MQPDSFPEAVSVADARAILEQDPEAIILDVREHEELEICSIPGAVHIPMQTVPERLAAISSDQRVLVMCHHGGRSMRVTRFLRAKGYEKVQNINGGIDAWALTFDPQMRRY